MLAADIALFVRGTYPLTEGFDSCIKTPMEEFKRQRDGGLTRSLSASVHLSTHPEAMAHWFQCPPCQNLLC